MGKFPGEENLKAKGSNWAVAAGVFLVVATVFVVLAHHPKAHGYIKTWSGTHCKEAVTSSIDPDWITHMASWSDLPHVPGLRSQGSQSLFLDKIFTVIGQTNRFFVEFGFNEPSYSGGGSGANSWKLYDEGWRGLLLDGGNENPSINLHKHFLFASNIAQLFATYNVPRELDLLSCDWTRMICLYLKEFCAAATGLGSF
jgi:hypothetical protein